MKLVETRRIDISKVRSMCIEYGYYTCGDVIEYEKMFQKCGLAFPILEIAQDIMEHSNVDKFLQMYGNDEKDFLECICYNLINDCCYTCVEIED